MTKEEFRRLKVGDRIETKAAAQGKIVRFLDEAGHPLAMVHFDGDPESMTFTVWPAVVVQKVL